MNDQTRDPRCDCQNPDGPGGVRHISMDCPVHNDLPEAPEPKEALKEAAASYKAMMAPRLPGAVSRQQVMDLIEAQIPLWQETDPPRHALSVLWGKVRDLNDTPVPSDAGTKPDDEKWICDALKQGTAGGNDPADCGWPVCGCDPHATKVIQTIEDAGYRFVRNGSGSDAGDIADLLIESIKFRMQCRVDACLARHGGDGKAATTSSGIGISYGFAREIVRTLERAAAEIERLRTVKLE